MYVRKHRHTNPISIFVSHIYLPRLKRQSPRAKAAYHEQRKLLHHLDIEKKKIKILNYLSPNQVKIIAGDPTVIGSGVGE